MTANDIDAAVFECPRCGTEFLAGLADGAIGWTPPHCSFGHPRTEMEQKLIGADGNYPPAPTQEGTNDDAGQ